MVWRSRRGRLREDREREQGHQPRHRKAREGVAAMINFTCAILHKSCPEREAALLQMLDVLNIEGRKGQIGRIFADRKPEGMPWAEFKTHLAQMQWEWSLAPGAQ